MATAPPVLVLLLTALVPVILSQSCQPLTSVACSPFVDGTAFLNSDVYMLTNRFSNIPAVGTQIFLPPGVTLEIAEHVTSSQVNLINLNPVEEPCRSTSIRLTCASWLRPCAKDFNGTFNRQRQLFFVVVVVGGLLIMVGTYIPVPEEPCENLCTDYGNYSTKAFL